MTETLNASCRRLFGFEPRSEQVRAYSAVQTNDTLVILKTGAGKSLIFNLYGLLAREQNPLLFTVVVSPFIALLKDQVDALNARFGLDKDGRPVLIEEELGTPVACFLGSAQSDLSMPARAARGEFAFVFCCPETLFSTSLPAHRALHVVDEVHLICECSEEFRSEYGTLGKLKAEFPNVRILALTATATEEVESKLLESLGIPKATVQGSSMNRANLSYTTRPKTTLVADVRGIATDIRLAGGKSIVYLLTRKAVDSVVKKLAARGIRALGYHGAMDSTERTVIQEEFSSAGGANTIVATISFGTGVDIRNVRLVVHMGLPRSIAAWAQECGCAGRDGKPSRAILYASPGDLRTHSFLDGHTPRLKAMAHLALGSHTCRRNGLLRAFGESCATPCRNSEGKPGCDVCEGRFVEMIATKRALVVLASLFRNGRAGETRLLKGLSTKSMFKVLFRELLRNGFLETMWLRASEGAFVVYVLSPLGLAARK